MGILEMDFERILGVPFFIVVLTLSYCDPILDIKPRTDFHGDEEKKSCFLRPTKMTYGNHSMIESELL